MFEAAADLCPKNWGKERAKNDFLPRVILPDAAAATARSSDPVAQPGYVRGPDGLEEEVLCSLLQAPADPVRDVLRRHDYHRDLLQL